MTSPKARYLQYRVNLDTTVARATPRLDKVDVAFTIDDSSAKVTIPNGDRGIRRDGEGDVQSHHVSAATQLQARRRGVRRLQMPVWAEFSGLCG